jgi:hypothetical protein
MLEITTEPYFIMPISVFNAIVNQYCEICCVEKRVGLSGTFFFGICSFLSFSSVFRLHSCLFGLPYQ